MYRRQPTNFYPKKAINYILDINRQNYKKNRVIIKRTLCYSNPGSGGPKDPRPFIFIVLLPIIYSINNYFRKMRR